MFLAFESDIVGENRQPKIKHLVGPTNINVNKFYGPFRDRMEVDAYAEGRLAAGCKCDIIIVPLVDTKTELERIIDMLYEADALQQKVVQDNQVCYSYHNRLTDLAADFESLAEK